jgi:O-antigen ligase
VSIANALLGRKETRTQRDDLLLVSVRVLAVVVLATILPLAGLVVLVLLVGLWLLRVRAELSAVLLVYVVVLFAVPSRYTVGSFSVTASMLVGFVAITLAVYGKMLPSVSTVTRGVEPVLRAGMLLLLFIGLSYAVNNAGGIHEETMSSADRNLVAMLGLVGLVLAVTAGIRTHRQLQTLLGVLVVMAGVLALVGLAQYLVHFNVAQWVRLPGFRSSSHESFVYARAGLSRVAGTARHPIEYGIVSAALLPLALHYGYWARTERLREGSYAVAALLSVAIALSLSRSAIFGTLVSAMVLLPTWASTRRFKVIVSVLVMIPLLNVVAPGITTTIGDLFSGRAGAGSIDKRSDATSYGLERWSDAQWFGHGFGASAESTIIIDNQWLNSLVEGGVVGLAALVGVIGSGVVSARKARSALRRPADRDLAQTVVAMLLSIAVGGFGLNIMRFPMVAGLLFLTLGVSGVLWRLAREEAEAHDAGDDFEAVVPASPSTSPA